MTVNALITGIGQVIGIGILKALRRSSVDCFLVGTDSEPKSAGLYMTDKSFVLPSAEGWQQDYLSNLSTICRREKINIIFPGSEPEIKVLAPVAQSFAEETGTFIMVGPVSKIRNYFDKWLTHGLLTQQGFPVPATIIPTQNNIAAFAKTYKFPLIVKPREGSASKGLHIIENEEQLLFWTHQMKNNVVVQEYLKPDHEEYTVGVFLTSPGKSHGAIVMRRELSGGVTFRAEVVEDNEITTLCNRVGELSGLVGPCNIQLRKTNHGPVILEINPRFSSTVAARAYFGFNEPAMAIKTFILKENLDPPIISKGTVLRYWEEKYIENR